MYNRQSFIFSQYVGEEAQESEYEIERGEVVYHALSKLLCFEHQDFFHMLHSWVLI